MIFLSTLLMALFITVFLIPLLKTAALRVNAVDVPNERKVHLKPIPKVGGIAMAVGMLAPVFLWTPLDPFGKGLLAGAGIIVLFGVIDDLVELRWRMKILGQVAAAMVIIHFGDLHVHNLRGLLPPGVEIPLWLSIPLTTLFIVGVTNAINLSDGLDGLAGGICLLSFLCIGFLCYTGRQTFGLMVSAAVVGAIFGFLRFNTHPAVIFMGDTGSQLLGFLAVCISVKVTQTTPSFNPLLPVLLLGFPILDTLSVMTGRILKGRSPFAADKNHFHHKLMGIGLYHSEAVLVIYVLQSALVTVAFLFRNASGWALLTTYGVFSVLVISGFQIAELTGFRLPRFDLVERVIKGQLKKLKGRHTVVRTAFPLIQFLCPAVLGMSCLYLSVVPGYFGLICLIMAGCLIAAVAAQTRWLGGILRFSLYLVIPLLIFQCEGCIVGDLPKVTRRLFDLSFGMMVFMVIMTLKFTRRRKGFRVTTLDFIVLFLALVVPNLPDPRIQSFHMGIVTTRIIALLFSYEVMIGELRGELKGQSLMAAGFLLLVAVKAFLGDFSAGGIETTGMGAIMPP